MDASLRLRLALLVVCSVALTVALVLYLTWQRVGETMIGMEEKNFATLLLVEEERLNTATLNHLAAKVRSVLLRKAQLRDPYARVQSLLRSLALQPPAGRRPAHRVLQPPPPPRAAERPPPPPARAAAPGDSGAATPWRQSSPPRTGPAYRPPGTIRACSPGGHRFWRPPRRSR